MDTGICLRGLPILRTPFKSQKPSSQNQKTNTNTKSKKSTNPNQSLNQSQDPNQSPSPIPPQIQNPSQNPSQNPPPTTESDSSSTYSGGFEHVKINVVPHLANSQGGAFGVPQTGQEPGAEPGFGQIVDGVPEEDDMTEERVLAIVRTFLVTTPNIFKKYWLAAPDEELLPFAHELFVYCRNNNIDINDYLGDWFPLAMTGVAVGAGMLGRHREHKKETKTLDAGKEKDFDPSSGFAEDHTPVEKKLDKYDSASGNNLPEEELDLETLIVETSVMNTDEKEMI